VQVVNGRWRGIMPFRVHREPISSQGRTGEPSPATAYREYLDYYEREGNDKAEGSYTEKLREALREWMKVNLGSTLSPLTFEYRLSRHRIVLVTGNGPYISHDPRIGSGGRGFTLHLAKVLSMDGVPMDKETRFFAQITGFALNRIVGRIPVKMLEAQAHE